IAWFAYLVCIRWVENKSRIFILVLASVILFSIIDSYSLFILWDQVALLILCGLFMSILRHLEQFRLKNPESWSNIIEYPGTLTATIAVIISIVMAAGILMPGMNPFVTDPYTAWMNYKGQAVITSGKGISQSPAAAGNASSGYGRDDSQIGGGFNYDYSPVMTVASDYKSYWRGETKSFYNGKGWELSEVEKATDITPVSRNVLLPKVPEINKTLLKTREVTQTFTMTNDKQSYAVLFAAYSADKLLTLGDGSDVKEGASTAVLWLSQQEELRWPELAGKLKDLPDIGKHPKTYSIVSQMPIIDPEGLRTAPAKLVKPELWLDYLQLPEGLPGRVKQLAGEITLNALNPYDKVKKIEEYLKANYKYTNKPDHSQVQSADFVDSFLFEMMEGYCDYYSTAMTVLTRTIGIPARWVKGFSSGQSFDDEVMSNVPDFIKDGIFVESGSFTVRNSNAHSWVEVYFEGYGWIPFEPTAGFTMPVTAEEKEIAPETADNEAAAGVNPQKSSPWLSNTIMASIYLVIAGAAGFLVWKFNLLRFTGTWRANRREINLNQQVVAEFERLLRFSKRKGYFRNDYETVRETVKRWIENKRWMQKDFEMLLGIFERAKYSSMNITDEEAAKASRIVKKLREQM
ncbi:MAG TPA: transglutaminaseTgpA domain-containing protein, partial [Bacilli bacterium]